MKPGQLLIVAGTIGIFLITFIASQGVTTGFLTADQTIGLEINYVESSDRSALLRWTTRSDAISVLDINNEQIAFAEAKHFSKQISGLQPRTTYGYTIRACNSYECEEKKSRVSTSSPLSQITGQVTGTEVAETLQTAATLMIYTLLGTVALLISGNIGYEFVNKRKKVGSLIKKGQKKMDNEEYTEAHDLYKQASQAFGQLEDEARLKHYNDLFKLYHNLRRYSEISEAQRLAEKYEQHTITDDELKRLGRLMAG